MPSEDSKLVKKEEPEEDNEDLKSLSSMAENCKKKPSSNSNNAAVSNSKSRPKEAKVKKEEPVETDDEDEKPISKRSSATKATKPRRRKRAMMKTKNQSPKGAPLLKQIRFLEFLFCFLFENEMKKKKKKGEEKKAAAGKEVKREKKVYDLPGQRGILLRRGIHCGFYEKCTSKFPIVKWHNSVSSPLYPFHLINSYQYSAREYTPRLIKKLEGIRVISTCNFELFTGLTKIAVDVYCRNGSLFVFGDKVVTNLGFGEAKNATMPSMINTLPYSEEVACGGYHTCVVTSNSLIFIIKCFCMFLFI
ncbi:hypothetical protein CXB51_025846 [Gossypium anomalum]|uniref:Uncharacterized protein n=1 Tax=Gossypium anomalum TaxID=47600 RepID=A0A8J5YEM6_9ROSI|nr:hypothetical protein CXB51_025846 [Gossypium anomalum]